jgi:hypothetical protein
LAALLYCWSDAPPERAAAPEHTEPDTQPVAVDAAEHPPNETQGDTSTVVSQPTVPIEAPADTAVTATRAPVEEGGGPPPSAPDSDLSAPSRAPAPATVEARVGEGGIWIGRAELMRRPTAGEDWEELSRGVLRLRTEHAAIADQDSNHDVHTLAAALVCVRVGEHCEDARQAILDAIGTEAGARWLAVGRNLGGYVIAADLLDLRRGGAGGPDGARVESWMRGWMTKELPDNNSGVPRRIGPFHSGANAAAQEGFVYAALAAYLRDRDAMGRAWNAFRTFVCDPGAPDDERMDLRRPVQDGWAHDDRAPCAVNPAGATKPVPSGQPGAGRIERLDGALIADMRRGGRFQQQPIYTQYPWVGLEGLVPTAVILERAGYPAFEIADRAVLRTHEYLWSLREATGDERWFDGVRAREIVHLVNVAYGVSFPINRTIGGGRTVGYTGWTHAAR